MTGKVASADHLHDFHPQLAVNATGDILCAFYEFGPMPTQNLINVVCGVSDDTAVSFAYRLTATDHPWDPAVDAPRSHGSPRTTFIGDYFGLAASDAGFFPFWTDTRTGIQEIFTAQVEVGHPSGPPAIDVVATNEVPHGRATLLSVSGSNFMPGQLIEVGVHAGTAKGHLLASGSAVVNSRGYFDWGASTQKRLGCDFGVVATAAGIEAATSVFCP
jgi:hypothetical protein